MLKIRLQGTTKDIKWFLKMLARDKRFIANKPSEPMAIKGSQKYKRAYTEIFRSEDEFKRYTAAPQPERVNIYYGSGAVYGVKNHSKSHKRKK